MALPNIFTAEETEKLVIRIERLTPESQPLWGKMTVAQMIAHCCIPYEIDPKNPPKISFFLKWALKNLFKSAMVNEKPYPKNSQTAPHFKMVEEKIFAHEQKRLIDLIRGEHSKGAAFFQEMPHYALGKLNSTEWNNLLYKHLDHHLRQFGV